MDMFVGYWETQILYSLVRSNLLEKIKVGNSDIEKLRVVCDIPEVSLNMLLKVAILWGLVYESDNKYNLTYKGELLTEQERGKSEICRSYVGR